MMMLSSLNSSSKDIKRTDKDVYEICIERYYIHQANLIFNSYELVLNENILLRDDIKDLKVVNSFLEQNILSLEQKIDIQESMISNKDSLIVNSNNKHSIELERMKKKKNLFLKSTVVSTTLLVLLFLKM